MVECRGFFMYNDVMGVSDMAISAEFMEKLNRLDVTNVQAATRYIDFLLYEQERRHRKTHIEFGCWEGQLKHISEKFDDPIEDFEEYM